MPEKNEKYLLNARTLISDFCRLVRMTGMYDAMNEAVLKAASKVAEDMEFFLSDTDGITVKTSEGNFYIEGTRVRATAADMDSFMWLSEELAKRSIGVLAFKSPVLTDDLVYLAYALRGGSEAVQVQSALESKLKKGITIGGPVVFQSDTEQDVTDSQELAKRAFIRSISASKDMLESLRMGEFPNLKKAKRSLQAIVDIMDKEEKYLLGLTTVREIDNYHICHGVNVAIIAIAIGKRLGFDRIQLSRLGMAAFFHDIGIAAIPESILKKKGELDQKEMELVRKHPLEGVKKILKLMGTDDIAMVAMLVSFEHHMNLDHTGYPKVTGRWRMNILSRIVKVANDFDTLTSGIISGVKPRSMDEALRAMFSAVNTRYDPTVMKAFANIFA